MSTRRNGHRRIPRNLCSSRTSRTERILPTPVNGEGEEEQGLAEKCWWNVVRGT